MEYNKSSNFESDEPRLCSGCNQFYGTKATNYMCSTCFKSSKPNNVPSQEEKLNFAKNESQQLANNEPLIAQKDVEMKETVQLEPEVKVQAEEMKKPETEPAKPKVSSENSSLKFFSKRFTSLLTVFFYRKRIGVTCAIRRQDSSDLTASADLTSVPSTDTETTTIVSTTLRKRTERN